MSQQSLPYAERTHRAQIAAIRRIALRALEQFGVEADRVRLLLHGYNTTFRVDCTDGRRFALRINTNSRRDVGEILGEQAWLRAISTDTDLLVPRPEAARDGSFVVGVESRELGRTVHAALNSWLPGPDVGRNARAEQLDRMGAALATLHTHAESWQPPEGTAFPVFSDPMFGDDVVFLDHPLIDPDGREVLVAALDRTRELFGELYRDARMIPLHADLHPDNVKWSRGRLAIFDFDDCGLGVPALDLGITTFYLRDNAELEDALFTGYQSVRPLPDFRPEWFEAILAARNLLLLNALLASETAEWRAEGPAYAEVSVRRLSKYLETGRFTREVPE